MSNKQSIMTQLRDEFDRWETHLSGLSEAQILSPTLPAGLSIRDVVSHLWAWQQRSLARLEAGLASREPQYPAWPDGLNPEDEDVDQINAWILATHQHKSWSQVHDDWRTQFLRVIEVGEQIPDSDLFDTQRFPWLDGYSLAQVLEGTVEHHRVDHREPIEAWLREHGQAS